MGVFENVLNNYLFSASICSYLQLRILRQSTLRLSGWFYSLVNLALGKGFWSNFLSVWAGVWWNILTDTHMKNMVVSIFRTICKFWFSTQRAGEKPDRDKGSGGLGWHCLENLLSEREALTPQGPEWLSCPLWGDDRQCSCWAAGRGCRTRTSSYCACSSISSVLIDFPRASSSVAILTFLLKTAWEEA